MPLLGVGSYATVFCNAVVIATGGPTGPFAHADLQAGFKLKRQGRRR